MNILESKRGEATIRLVNDRTKMIKEGKPMESNLTELKPLCSLGKSKEKFKNAAGIIPDVAKLILPQKIFQEGSVK